MYNFEAFNNRFLDHYDSHKLYLPADLPLNATIERVRWGINDFLIVQCIRLWFLAVFNPFVGATTAVLALAALIWYVCVWPHTEDECRELAYCPHLVTNVLQEYERGTNGQVVRSTVMQKCRRLASLPIADRWHAHIVEGSCEVIVFLLEKRPFFMAGGVRAAHP
jgi:hypothetical protein